MELVLFEDLIIRIVSNSLQSPQEIFLVDKILRNPHSVILASDRLFNHVRKSLPRTLFEELDRFVLSLKDTSIHNVLWCPDNTQGADFEDEFDYLMSLTKSNFAFGLSYSRQLCRSKDGTGKRWKLASIALSKKPNRHWLMTQLAANHPDPVITNCQDFSDAHKVTKFFRVALQLPKELADVKVFDRFVNLDHDRLAGLSEFRSIEFYTFRDRWKPSDFRRKIDSINSKFSGARVFTVQDRVFFLHGRSIVIGDLVIWADNDFANLNPGKHQDWRIAVQLSKAESQRLLDSCAHFTIHHNSHDEDMG